ncbi:MAG: hypothetical protein EBR92_06020 [Alphaproteobacteria bacterium]|nr:hypothetical protein [Alphaproteobacteria bacterium]
MSLYSAYLEEIAARKTDGLHAKPIDDGALLSEIIDQIKDAGNVHRADSLQHLIYNTLNTNNFQAVIKEYLLIIDLG